MHSVQYINPVIALSGNNKFENQNKPQTGNFDL